jgi:hypothetical protein
MDQYRSTRQVESSVASEHVSLSQAWRRAAPRAACHCALYSGSVGPRAETQTSREDRKFYTFDYYTWLDVMD